MNCNFAELPKRRILAICASSACVAKCECRLNTHTIQKKSGKKRSKYKAAFHLLAQPHLCACVRVWERACVSVFVLFSKFRYNGNTSVIGSAAHWRPHWMRVNATSSIWNMRKNWQAKGWGRIEKSLPKNVGSSWAAMFASNSERSCRMKNMKKKLEKSRAYMDSPAECGLVVVVTNWEAHRLPRNWQFHCVLIDFCGLHTNTPTARTRVLFRMLFKYLRACVGCRTHTRAACIYT